ncbi:MAG: hypothetical protein OIF47_11225 [Marinibacterium sp.]|nr:hypothetical protein [Marinibacterium sp.]
MKPTLVAIALAAAPLAGALPATADTPLSADAFDAYTHGKTLFYGADGALYGVECYLPNRRVVWSFLDGRCQDGIWYPQGDEICFVYEDVPGPQCWTFHKGPSGLRAYFESQPPATELYEAQDVGEDMLCLGPDVGV